MNESEQKKLQNSTEIKRAVAFNSKYPLKLLLNYLKAHTSHLRIHGHTKNAKNIQDSFFINVRMMMKFIFIEKLLPTHPKEEK